MKEYELVHEIKNSCPNNQMRDIFFEEIECESGTVTVHAVVDGMTEKYVFTPI